MKTTQFVRKPVVVEAEQFDDHFFYKYYRTAHHTGVRFFDDFVVIQTSSGIGNALLLEAKRGDWIITKPNGEKEVCRSEEFEQYYEPIEQATDNKIYIEASDEFVDSKLGLSSMMDHAPIDVDRTRQILLDVVAEHKAKQDAHPHITQIEETLSAKVEPDNADDGDTRGEVFRDCADY